MRHFVFCGVSLALLVGAGDARAREDQGADPPEARQALPFVYQGVGAPSTGHGRVEWSAGVGSREARPLGQRGFEQDLTVTFGLTRFLTAQLGGGALIGEGGATRGAVHLEALGHILRQQRAGLNLAVGVGFLRDYRGASILRARLLLDRSLGRFSLAFSGLLEAPFASGRDDVDLILGLAAAYALRANLRLGVEAVAEDLEALWQRDESEGGAAFLAGPTIWYSPHARWVLKLNVGGLMLVATPAATPSPARYGAQGRLVVGYLF